MSAAGVIDLYERHAAAWAALRGESASIETGWLERFRAALPLGGAVLDLGCGSGAPIAAWLIERGYGVTGVDASPTLIDICRARFPAPEWPAPEWPATEWIVADMRQPALTRCFDGMIAWHSFFHLSPDDQRQMFDVFAKLTLSGGALMFTSGDEDNVTIGEFQGEPLYHASLALDEYRALLDRSGFDLINHASGDPGCGGATVWLARRR